jgi:hypothetical protein
MCPKCGGITGFVNIYRMEEYPCHCKVKITDIKQAPEDTISFICKACGEDEDFTPMLGVYLLPICRQCLEWIGRKRIEDIGS